MNKNYYYRLSFLVSIIAITLTALFSCSEDSPSEPSNENTITISSQGGEYTTEDGIIIRVPAGAVDNDTDILIENVSSSEVESIFESRAVSVDNLLACIDGTPDGTVFKKPIQVSGNRQRRRFKIGDRRKRKRHFTNGKQTRIAPTRRTSARGLHVKGGHEKSDIRKKFTNVSRVR